MRGRSRGSWGFGTALAVAVETRSFAAGDLESSAPDGFVAGSYLGETTIGFELESRYRRIGPVSYLSVGLALTVRSPGFIGLALAALD